MKKSIICFMLIALWVLTCFLAGCSNQCDCCNEDNFPKHGNTVGLSYIETSSVAVYDWQDSVAIWKEPIASCKTFIRDEKRIDEIRHLLYESERQEEITDLTSAELLRQAHENKRVMVLFKHNATYKDYWELPNGYDYTYEFLTVYYVAPDGTVIEDDGFDRYLSKFPDGKAYQYLLSLAR